MGAHYIERCEHGTVMGQCRCPGPKTERIVPCLGPPYCTASARAYGIALVAFAGTAVHGGDRVPEGAWVQTYAPEANDGLGDVVWTTDRTLALAFPTAADAMRCWRQVPANRPLRDDGRPNRPLTAFTVSIEEIPE